MKKSIVAGIVQAEVDALNADITRLAGTLDIASDPQRALEAAERSMGAAAARHVLDHLDLLAVQATPETLRKALTALATLRVGAISLRHVREVEGIDRVRAAVGRAYEGFLSESAGADEHPLVEIPIRTRKPEKWRFLDTETGETWRWESGALVRAEQDAGTRVD